jgi:hypothetical protein
MSSNLIGGTFLKIISDYFVLSIIFVIFVLLNKMVKMNINQALKLKKKIIGQITRNNSLACEINSIQEGNPRKYSVRDLLEQNRKLISELVDLKVKIHTANLPVYHKIFRLSELKSQASTLNLLPVDEGKKVSRFKDTGEIFCVEIDIVEKDQKTKEIEDEIEKIQDELDFHNSTTTI